MEHKYEFSSTQVELSPEHAKRVSALAADIPEEDLSEDGREDAPHVTVKYGLHTNHENEVRELLKDEPPVRALLGTTSLFKGDETGANHDVVKIDVESEDLRRLNKKLSDALEHTDTHPEYKPHVTVAYVKPGKGDRHVGQSIKGPAELTFDTVYFSDKDGQKIPISLGGDKVERAMRSAMDDYDAED